MRKTTMPSLPFTDLNSYLRQLFGGRVWKISIDAGFTCPNRDGTLGSGGCIYCNERGSGTGERGSMTIAEQIRTAKAPLERRYKPDAYLAYFQSFTNTYAPVATTRSRYMEALAEPGIVGLSIGTRPDCVADEMLDMLAELNEQTWVNLELGLQSAHDDTLKRINRGHDYAAFVDAVGRARSRGLEVTAHVILGLPGETTDDMFATADALAGLDIQGVKPHMLFVVRGTELHRMYERGEVHCFGREEYIDILLGFLARIPPEVVVHRLTGDPHPRELVAPMWALDKQQNMKIIRNTMRERGWRQGSLYNTATRRST